MRVFVTGAAGFIGRTTVEELLSHNHQVLGLARSDANADILTKLGAKVHRGGLDDPESLKSGVRLTDGVIHLAFNHDLHDPGKGISMDLVALTAIGEALSGTGKPLVIASGLLGMPSGIFSTEDTKPILQGPLAGRFKSSELVYKLSIENKVRGSVVRLSPTVHDEGDWGLIPMFIEASRKAGVVVYPGDGSNRWPAIHRKDSAVLFRLALEKGTGGATYNGSAEQGVSLKDISAVVGKHLQLPVQGKTLEEAQKELGFLAGLFDSDVFVSSDKTQSELGWKPTQIGLLEDMEKHYF